MGEQIKHRIDYQDLEQRIFAFNCLELPGQPRAMHMATSYLVADLWSELRRLRAALRVIADHPDWTDHGARAAGVLKAGECATGRAEVQLAPKRKLTVMLD